MPLIFTMNNRLADRKVAWLKIRKLIFNNCLHHNLEIKTVIDIIDLQINTEHLSIDDLGRYEVRDGTTGNELSTLFVSHVIVGFLNEINTPLNTVEISWHPEEYDANKEITE